MPTLSSELSNRESSVPAHPPSAAAGTPWWLGWLAAAIPVGLLLPFLGTAFRIDDPMYMWAAQHIRLHPADPYGFLVNWYGIVEPMATVMKNPPVVCYYMALAMSALGSSEWALHLAFLVPAYLLGLGIYRLAGHFCRQPALAMLAATLTPVFFVSSMTLMSDITMLAFWVWAVHLWMQGLGSHTREVGPASESVPRLAAAALLVGLAALTKYFAVALIPLLLVYSLLRQRSLGRRSLWWAACLLIPVAMLGWYQWATARLYGRGLLLDAASYASAYGPAYGKLSFIRLVVDFAFVGGCVASLLFFSGRLWTRRAWATGAACVAGATAVIYFTGVVRAFTYILVRPGVVEALSAQLALWGVAGVSLLILAVLDLRARRDAEAVLLFLWVIGTLVFAGLLNWAVNGRAMLPLIVPAGLLVARRLERRDETAAPSNIGLRPIIATALPLVFCAALSLAAVWADSEFAETGRSGARLILSKYPPQGRTVWFRGHWGFQHYMEQGGARAQNLNEPLAFAPQDVLAMPSTNPNIGDTNLPPWARFEEFIDLHWGRYFSTMGNGAGFYADVFGPLPFAVAPLAPERFAIVRVKPELRGK